MTAAPKKMRLLAALAASLDTAVIAAESEEELLSSMTAVTSTEPPAMVSATLEAFWKAADAKVAR